MSTHGGKRKGAGRKPGSTTDNIKLGISISRKNAEWLRSTGKQIGKQIDKAIDFWLDNHPQM